MERPIKEIPSEVFRASHGKPWNFSARGRKVSDENIRFRTVTVAKHHGVSIERCMKCIDDTSKELGIRESEVVDAIYKEIVLDKIEGMFAAHAVGDALGAPHEFKYNHYQYTGRIQYPAVLRSQWQGIKTTVVGQVTDDTEMALSLADSILKNGGYDRRYVVQNYIEWANSKPFGMGRNTRALFYGIKTVEGYEKRLEKMPSDSNSRSEANGSLMRAYPMALVRDGPSQYISIDASLTNPNPVNISASKVYIYILRRLILDDYDSVTDLIDESKTHIEEPSVLSVIDKVLNGVDVDLSVTRGWVLHALYAGLWSLKNFNTPEEIYRYNIVPPKGRGLSDTDTNAAISGSLLGARFGIKRLNKDPIFRYNYDAIKIADTSKGDSPRPEKYHPSRIPIMVRELGESIFDQIDDALRSGV